MHLFNNSFSYLFEDMNLSFDETKTIIIAMNIIVNIKEFIVLPHVILLKKIIIEFIFIF